SLGVALALCEAVHYGVDAGHIREYAEIFKPLPWIPPSPAMRRLGELQTIRAGIVSSLTEWKNRCESGLADDVSVHTAVIGDGRVPAGAVLASRDMTSERCRAAVLDG